MAGTENILSKDNAKELHSHWAHVAEALSKELEDAAYRSWIMPIEPRSCAGGRLELAVATRFIKDWVKSHYLEQIRNIWSDKFGKIAVVEIIVESSSKTSFIAMEEPANNSDEDEDYVPVAVVEAPKPRSNDELTSPLDARFTFDNYVVGKPNELAYAAAQKVAANNGVSFNPLFLYGSSGLGKTHLMHAIAWAISEKTPSRKVVYMSAEKFMYQFIRALKEKTIQTFKENMRSVDVLMIDDIQFICGKDYTQEEFFHTFNSMIDQNKQVIFSADKAPSDLEGLEDRLRSRLGWGLVVDIHPTTYELRLGILQQKCQMMKREVPKDVLEFLAHKISSNVRELEGALNRIIAHSELIGCEINISTTQDLLQDLIRANDVRISIEDIQRRVAEHYNIRISDLHSPRRSKNISRPRQIAMYLCKILTEYSLPDIGRKFGGRDHTTIMHGVRKIEELLSTDADVRADVEILKKSFTRS